jgi:hypothetical protein
MGLGARVPVEWILLRTYLEDRSDQWRRGSRCLWLINASARPGDGTALAYGRWAREQSLLEGVLEVRTINLAVDGGVLARLEKDLVRGGPPVAISLPGTIEVQIQHVLRLIGVEPAFIACSPFAGEGVSIETLQRLITRKGRKSELLLRLDARAYEELAGSVSQQRFDAVLPSALWSQADRQGGLQRAAVLYSACLRSCGYSYVYEIPVRVTGSQPPPVRWLFATRSPAGVTLMSELLCRRERERSDAGEADTGELGKAIERFGASIGHASTTQIIHAMSVSPELFGKFCKSEYRSAIGALVRAGAIVAPCEKAIKDSEWLSFRPRPHSPRQESRPARNR